MKVSHPDPDPTSPVLMGPDPTCQVNLDPDLDADR